MKNVVGPFIGGVVFAIGLAVSGMTQPAKIVGFFEFGALWDASLAFVMLGALLVYAPAYRWVTRKLSQPIWSARFFIPTRVDIDRNLITGAALFGIGWGLGGYCPGPAITSAGAGVRNALVFGATMLVAIAVTRAVQRLGAPSVSAQATTDG